MAGRFISDLGERSLSRGHAVMNGSFIVQGLLVGGAALSAGRWSLRLVPARLFLLMSALGLVLIAYAPADRNLMLHIWAARGYFGAGTLGMLFWGLAYAGQRRAALLAACVAALGDFVLMYGPTLPATTLGAGTMERLAAYPLPLWLAYMGWTFLHPPAKPVDL